MLYGKDKVKLAGQFRFIVIIFVIVAALMVSSAVIELKQSKKELYQLMTKQAHSLLESLIIASQNTLNSTTYLDKITHQRLLNNALYIKLMYERGIVTDKILSDISRKNKIYRINIFNNKGELIYSNFKRIHMFKFDGLDSQKFLNPIFSGKADTLTVGYKKAKGGTGYRYAVALAAEDNSAIVLNVDADEMLDFKKNIHFGALIRQVVQANPQIVYIALQGTDHIIAASGNVSELDGIEDSPFLTKSFYDSTFSTRTARFNSGEIFEAVHPFTNSGVTIGLFRLGLSLDTVKDINERIYRRLIFITILLIAIGFFLFVYIFTKQRLDILQRQYQVVETYSSGIIDNVSDAIIVFDDLSGIKIFNTAAERLFNKKRRDVHNKGPEYLFGGSDCQFILDQEEAVTHISCSIHGNNKYLLLAKSSFKDSHGNKNTIILISDLTEQKHLENQIERQKRLTAMGELASGVAHEIRNPLNAIGTIIQQLDKDFEPSEEQEEYHQLAGLVYNEVKRINDTVQDFLRFARPEPVRPAQFSIADLFSDLKKQYSIELGKRKIKFNLDLNWKGDVFWDFNQIKQVFINLIQNAVEAIDRDGTITIAVDRIAEKRIEIFVKDDGPGMDEDTKANVFNLYFTTKARGTGIGLSIVQRIIFEHSGSVDLKSEQGKGTAFIIDLPVRIFINEK
ncbi:GHKL domain-containing protein [bacterium]|nr:GHKL domain-containing protein [bacterium]